MSARRGPDQGKHPVLPPVVVVLAIDDVEAAYQRAFDIALDACASGNTVAHLHADPQVDAISFHPDGTHDLGTAISTIPTSSGRLIKIAIGGLLRPQVSDVLASVRPLVDKIVLSGPEPALTQMSLEIATLADSAVCLGGTEPARARLRSILDQLGIAHATSPTAIPSAHENLIPKHSNPKNSNPKIVPPGRL